MVLVLLLVNLLFIFLCRKVSQFQNFVKLDYFFALLNLGNFLPIIFLTNTLFTFLFILELNSVFIFYKFIVSKVWKSDVLPTASKTFMFRNLPNHYLNMLFFQYWATFFSSVLTMFVVVSYIYLYGTTEWLPLNILNAHCLTLGTIKLSNLTLVFILIFAFFIKVGFTPVHLYKIELYKGIPLFAIFFYSTYYFLVFFLFFILLILVFLQSFIMYWWYLLTVFLVCGGLFAISLLFDVNYLKAFFAYSSVINSLGFLAILVSLITG